MSITNTKKTYTKLFHISRRVTIRKNPVDLIEKYLVAKCREVSGFHGSTIDSTYTNPEIQALVIRNLRHDQDPISRRERSLSYEQTVSTRVAAFCPRRYRVEAQGALRSTSPLSRDDHR